MMIDGKIGETRKERKDIFEFRNSLLYIQNNVINSFKKSFYEENKILKTIELRKEKLIN